MKAAFSLFLAALAFGLAFDATRAQSAPARPSATATQQPAPARQPAEAAREQPRTSSFDLTEYGIQIEPEPRLIVVMSALEAAGFEAGGGAPATPLREIVRRDLVAPLDPELRARLRTFYERNRLPAPATPAGQAARYVSLALALGPAPSFESPARTDDLPSGLLEVLDFAPLVREFYRRTGMDERLPEYVRMSREAGNRLRPATASMARSVLSYLHTRPQLSYVERVPAPPSSSAPNPKPKGGAPARPAPQVTRERERRFLLVPDLLAPPGAVNFRVIRDDYYAIVPFGTDPASSELRRAYLRFVLDPLVLRFNRDIAARRADVRAMLDELRAKGGDAASITPDVFLAVERSLVDAADARMTEQARLTALAGETSVRLRAAQTETERASITRDAQAARAAIEDSTTAQLADAYERGAVLSFFFAEQLRGLESSGFDVAAFFPDMMQSFDAARERRRPAEYAAARARHLEARRKAQEVARSSATDSESPAGGGDPRRAALVRSLGPVEELLRTKNHAEARSRLQSLMLEFQGEPRIFFALGQADSISAEDAFDEELRARRLNSALTNYRHAVERADPQADRALVCRAHAAAGRILAFLERNAEARQAFDAALRSCDPASAAYRDAQAGKTQLPPQ